MQIKSESLVIRHFYKKWQVEKLIKTESGSKFEIKRVKIKTFKSYEEANCFLLQQEKINKNEVKQNFKVSFSAKERKQHLCERL